MHRKVSVTTPSGGSDTKSVSFPITHCNLASSPREPPQVPCGSDRIWADIQLISHRAGRNVRTSSLTQLLNRLGTWGTERLSDLLKSLQLITDRAAPKIQIVCVPEPGLSLTYPNTVTHCLTMGIHSGNCMVRQFVIVKTS